MSGALRNYSIVMALCAAVAAAALAVSAFDEGEDASLVQAQYGQGVAHLAAGDSEHARIAFRAALEIDGTHVPSRLELARLDEARGDWEAAVWGFSEVVALAPNQIEARTRLAHLLAWSKHQEDVAAAERHAQEALELAPEDAEVLGALALVAHVQGNAGEASDWADQALAIDRANRTAGLIAARLAADAGEIDAALEWIDAILADTPADLEVSTFKSQLLSGAGREADLRTHLAKMAGMFSDAWIREWLVYLQEKAGDAAGAYATLKAFSDQHPDDPKAAFAVVDFVRRTHGAEPARNEFEDRIAAAGATAALQLRLDLAAFEEATGRPEAAENVLSALIADVPNSVEADTARLQIARQHLASGERDEAQRIVETVLDRDSRRPDALALHASLLLDEGDADEAIRVLRIGVEEAPDDVGLTLALARAYELAGHLELAQDRYGAATRTSDFDPEVVAAHAEFLSNTKGTEAAIYLLEAAAHRHPENADILARLETARSRNKGD